MRPSKNRSAARIICRRSEATAVGCGNLPSSFDEAPDKSTPVSRRCRRFRSVRTTAAPLAAACTGSTPSSTAIDPHGRRRRMHQSRPRPARGPSAAAAPYEPRNPAVPQTPLPSVNARPVRHEWKMEMACQCVTSPQRHCAAPPLRQLHREIRNHAPAPTSDARSGWTHRLRRHSPTGRSAFQHLPDHGTFVTPA